MPLILSKERMPVMPSSPGIFVLYDGFGISVKRLEMASQLGLHQVKFLRPIRNIVPIIGNLVI